MKKRNLIVVGALLLAVGGMTLAQQQTRPSPVAPQNPTLGSLDQPTPRTELKAAPPSSAGAPSSNSTQQQTRPAPAPAPSNPVDPLRGAGQEYRLVPSADGTHFTQQQAKTEAKPEEQTIDQLLDVVDAIRAQKAELEKKEKAVMAVLRKKAEKQKQRIDSLDGVGIPEAPLPSSPSIVPTGPIGPPGGQPPVSPGGNR